MTLLAAIGLLVAACGGDVGTTTSPTSVSETASASADWTVTERDEYRISVPSSYTVVDPEDPSAFMEASEAAGFGEHASVVALRLAEGTAPDFWAFDFTSAEEGGLPHGVNVIVVPEATGDPREYLPTYRSGVAAAYGISEDEISAQVVDLPSGQAIRARVRVTEQDMLVQTTHFVIADGALNLVLSVTTPASWSDDHPDIIEQIAASIETEP